MNWISDWQLNGYEICAWRHNLFAGIHCYSVKFTQPRRKSSTLQEKYWSPGIIALGSGTSMIFCNCTFRVHITASQPSKTNGDVFIIKINNNIPKNILSNFWTHWKSIHSHLRFSQEKINKCWYILNSSAYFSAA